MSTRWGPVGRSALAVLAALMVLVVAVVSPPGAAAAPAQIPPGPTACLVDRPCELSAGLPGADGMTPRLAPNGARVVFVRVSDGLADLYSVTVAGSPSPRRIDDPVTSGTQVDNFVVSPDGARVVYTLRDTGGDRLYRLRSVPIAGPASAGVLLNWPSPDDVFRRVSPDSTRVVNRLGDVLFSSPIQGGGLVRINGPEVPSWPFLVDATNTRALYMSASAGQEDIYSAPMSGSGTRYNLTALLNAEVVDNHIQLTSGSSQRVVFTAARADGLHLYSSRLVPGIVPPPV